ncbi:hypothetical protein [Maritimibacter sp. 55A14]|uniref:hypothetical protein n=1 Tax=Maritimibacter sp. 55A14 TaxID=2174844 RepID=UPI0013048FDD|nr:hypothetical protein [Maritimibacter sp. 55A14]
MPELRLTETPAIVRAPVERGGTRLVAVGESGVLTLVLRRGDPQRLAQEIGAALDCDLPAVGGSTDATGGARLLRPAAERAHLVTPGSSVPSAAEGETFYGIDQSDYWSCLNLSGPLSRACLERLWKPDLGDAAFPPGAVARSALGPVAAVLCRLRPAAYLLLVPRSYAQAGFDELETSLAWV